MPQSSGHFLFPDPTTHLLVLPLAFASASAAPLGRPSISLAGKLLLTH